MGIRLKSPSSSAKKAYRTEWRFRAAVLTALGEIVYELGSVAADGHAAQRGARLAKMSGKIQAIADECRELAEE